MSVKAFIIRYYTKSESETAATKDQHVLFRVQTARVVDTTTGRTEGRSDTQKDSQRLTFSMTDQT